MRSITPGARAVTPFASPPPEQRPLFRGTRPRKRWRYVAVLGEELMACAACVQVGPARQTFWALLDRRTGELRERTRLVPRRDELELGRGDADGQARLRIRDRGVELDVAIEEEAGVAVVCPHGRLSVWTRKQAGVAASGTWRLDGEPARGLRARAVIDDTCGHHARVTEWRWSAGVGELSDGRPAAWNLVSGVNDPARGSERAVWVDGVPREAPPIAFATDLSAISCEDGSTLAFNAEAERARRERMLLVASDYRAPFGTFAGALPGGFVLAYGLGVMEQHSARW